MLEIEYKGANAVVFTTKKTRVVFDPKVSLAGGTDIDVSGDVVVVTESRFLVEGDEPRLVFDSPGEYEVADMVLTGIAAQRHIDTTDQGRQAVIYRMEVGGVRVAIIGNIAAKLDETQLEYLGVVDIVVIPIGGGGYTLDPTDATAIVRQIEPRAVVPVHYADVALSYEVPQEEFDVFVGELGAGIIEAGTKWKVKSDSSLSEQLSVVRITRS